MNGKGAGVGACSQNAPHPIVRPSHCSRPDPEVHSPPVLSDRPLVRGASDRFSAALAAANGTPRIPFYVAIGYLE
jgi:hypothetical protein